MALIKRIAIVWYIILLSSGCKVMEPVKSESITSMQLKEISVDTLLKGAKISVNLDTNFLKNITNQLSIQDTVYIPSANGEIKYRYYRDSAGKLVQDCIASDRLIKLFERYLNTQQTVNTEPIKKPTYFGFSGEFIMGMMLPGNLICLVLLVIKFFKR